MTPNPAARRFDNSRFAAEQQQMTTAVHHARERSHNKEALSLSRRCAVVAYLLKQRLKEWLEFDSTAVRRLSGIGGLATGGLLYLCGRAGQGFAILAKLHRAASLSWASRVAERLARAA